MRIISILIKINYVILLLLILGLMADFISGGTSILLPGLGLIIAGSFILSFFIVADILFQLFLILLRKKIGKSSLR